MCEATRSAPADAEVESDDPTYPFRVCNEVARRLKACALTPLEWYRLAAIHGPQAFLLHEDFYDDDGIAMQPGMRVPTRRGERLPSLADVEPDMESLLDYWFSRRQTDERDAILRALGRFDKQELFRAVERRLGKPPRNALEREAYTIFQQVTPEQLAATLETRWGAIREGPYGELYAIAELAAASIPAVGVATTLALIHQAVERLRWPDRTRDAPVHYMLAGHLVFCLRELVPTGTLLELVLQLMDRLPPKFRASQVLHALTHFQDERVLDWIERNVARPLTYEWGTAVACSEPSWDRLAKWLNLGRPLSLIALDAMKNCRGYDPQEMSGVFMDRSPKIQGSVSLRAVRRELQRYAGTDPVPRVQKATALVLANLDKIFASPKP
jgi:hypothetical protein